MVMAFIRNKALIIFVAVFLLSASSIYIFAQESANEENASPLQAKYICGDKKFKIPRLTDTDNITFLIRSAKENIQFSHKVKVTTRVVDETVFLKNRELVSYK